ncbi:hypothetical protein [Streptomyces sp. NPDC002133]|uniref:hypothetical protein n=1 Tax=Streptomyces sp. NPDC002133 TaxID=3154409 RepID=UPI0033286A69
MSMQVQVQVQVQVSGEAGLDGCNGLRVSESARTEREAERAHCRFPVAAVVPAGAPAPSNSTASHCGCLAHVYGNAGDRPGRRRRYPPNMTDAEWAEIRAALLGPG